jgi:hypothetical protein
MPYVVAIVTVLAVLRVLAEWGGNPKAPYERMGAESRARFQEESRKAMAEHQAALMRDMAKMRPPEPAPAATP